MLLRHSYVAHENCLTDILNPDNRLFSLARRDGRPPSALVAIAVVFGVLALALIPGQILGRMVLMSHDGVPRFPSDLQPIVEPIVQNVTMFLLVFVGLWTWLRFSARGPSGRWDGNARTRSGARFAEGSLRR